MSTNINNNIYLEQVWGNLPRLLAFYNMDKTSEFYGVGDRQFWGWKTIDFANGTFQGAANGLSLLIKENLLPDFLEQDAALSFIDAQFLGTSCLIRGDGSLEEAFPYEASFCVTALVAYDLLSACENLKNIISAEKIDEYMDIIERLIKFLMVTDETHGFISNHLTTASLALLKWAEVTNDKSAFKRGNMFLERVLNQQSDEGWFSEYSGADAGYQTWTMFHMAEIYSMKLEDNIATAIKNALDKSCDFLKYFVQPDGSFGGIYGQRSTRFYMPAGFEIVALEISDALSIADFMRSSIANKTTVTLDAIDQPNLIPFFNAYCYAAVALKRNNYLESSEALPAFDKKDINRKYFEEAGLLINKDKNNYTVISIKKGGVIHSYNYKNKITHIDAGALYKNKKETLYTTQTNNEPIKLKEEDGGLIIDAPLIKINRPYPTAFKFMVLRALNITVMRWRPLRDLIKKMLVALLVSGRKPSGGINRRTINFSENIAIKDEIISSENLNLEKVNDTQTYYGTHMASQGYWQKQDMGK